MKADPQETEEKVIQALGVSLALNPSEIRSDSRLIVDLGMDSLDFLDLMFALEKTFNTKLRDADFDRVLRPDKSEAALENEFLTESEISALLPVIPELGNTSKNQRIPRNTLFSYITVETLVRMIQRKICPSSSEDQRH